MYLLSPYYVPETELIVVHISTYVNHINNTIKEELFFIPLYTLDSWGTKTLSNLSRTCV